LHIARQCIDGIAVDACVGSDADQTRGVIQFSSGQCRACVRDQSLLALKLIGLLLLLQLLARLRARCPLALACDLRREE
jgi:hypothetical protein